MFLLCYVHVPLQGIVCVRVHVMVGPDKQRSLDSGGFELVSSHQQGIRITCLAHHPALYMYMYIHLYIHMVIQKACGSVTSELMRFISHRTILVNFEFLVEVGGSGEVVAQGLGRHLHLPVQVFSPEVWKGQDAMVQHRLAHRDTISIVVRLATSRAISLHPA